MYYFSPVESTGFFMLSRQQIKFVNSLYQKKFRREHGCFVAEGSKLVEELLQSRLHCSGVYATGNWIEKKHKLLNLEEAKCIEVSENELSRISTLTTPNQALAIFEIPEYSYDPGTADREIVLMLDSLKDPGNLGTILRTADWFGIQHVICSLGTVDLYNPKTIQATMGSVARVQVYYLNLIEVLYVNRKEIPVYGSLLQGKPLDNFVAGKNGFILIGNEAHGISPEIQAYITHPLLIPSYSDGVSGIHRPESLNAAIAAAILCWEFRKGL